MEERLKAILRLAIKYAATDIHFNLRYQEINIELRIDGVCRPIKTLQSDYKLIRYLQYLSNLDIGKNLKPQTGQFDLEVDGVSLSLRFALINGNNYSNGVLRILNNELKIDAHTLSKLEDQNLYFRYLMTRNIGLILFSGPTGSGKTTTLYSLLNATRNKKIFTLEDPIEVYNDNFVQVQINKSVGLDYENAVAQVLRHDPDIIMIGEIRDFKAARMAVVAANTGHLVLSTIHSSSASSCISRLLELGVIENHLYENLLCIANQRMLINKNTKEKVVLYEIMDRDEIEYFREHGCNSSEFINIESQIKKGIRDGIFEEIQG